jgi:lysophospholipase L1-like esterase
MNRFIKAAVAFLCAGLALTPAFAQLTTVTAAKISFGGVPIAAGTVTFTPVNAQGTAIAFSQGGGGLNAPAAFSCTITAGAITGTCSIPDAALTSPANILYAIQITDTGSHQAFVLQAVPNVTGTTFALDSYGPPANTTNVQSVQASVGAGNPPASCVMPSTYTKTSGGGSIFFCVNGTFVAVSGMGGLPLTGGTLTGPLVLAADPTSNLQAATKEYVDTHAGSGTGPTPIAGALADFDFLQGSGTSVTDISGNGNGGTLGTSTLAPTWSALGLAFSGQQQVALPASLNTAKTFIFGVYLTPLTNSPTLPENNQFPTLITSSMAPQGLNLLYTSMDNGGPQGNTAVFAPTIFASNGFPTAAPNLLSGFHVIAFVLGTGSGSLDHIYLDGLEVANYSAQGSSAGAQTTGNLFLGSSNVGTFTTSGLNGTMYRFVAIAGNTLTASQIQAISGQIRTDVSSRGVEVSPRPFVSVTPTLWGVGDSITFGTMLTTPATQDWMVNLSLTNQPAYKIVNDGIFGVYLKAVVGSEPNRIAQNCPTQDGPSVAVVFLGTNDLTFFSSGSRAINVANTEANLGAEIQTLKDAGCRVFVATMLSRGGNDGYGSTIDSDKDLYDTYILAASKSLGADGVIDFAANPNLGADNANANTTFFADTIHPTAAGHLSLAAAASNALNYYFGSNAASPSVVTTATHTILSGEGYISANPTANQTLTLPDCTGPSGATYTVSNIQSAFTVGVVTGSSSQLINGLSSGTAVSVPSNSSVVFRDVPNPKNVSGCHWEK